jgi:hypothetical protein
MKQSNQPISSVWPDRAYRTSAAARHMTRAVDLMRLKRLCHRDPLVVAVHYVRYPGGDALAAAALAAAWKRDPIQFLPIPGATP